ncbi:MAG: two-component regulator propeller domain-containing protein, partial [Marinoscillum sp.]
QLLLASNGDLWAATGGNGLVRMRKNAETFDYQLFIHDEVDQNTLSSDYIASIEEDHLGRIWVGSGGSGVNRFLPESNTFKRYDLKFQQPHVLTVFDTWDIYEDSSQNLWVGTGEDGVYLYDATKDVFRPHRNRGYNEYGEITSNKLRNLYEDSDGNIWVGTFTGGVSIYSSHNSFFELYKSYQNDPKSLPHNSVTAFAERPDGKVWVGTDGGGLGLFNVQDRTFERYMRHDPSDDGSLGTNAILSMLYDSQDNLWVGTWGGGLHRFNELTQSFDQFKVDPTNPHSLISNKVWEIVEDNQHRLWIATLQGGLHLFDKDKGEFTAFYTLTGDSRLPDQNVWTVYKDHEGTIWVGTEMLYEVIEHQDGIRFKAYVPDSKDPCRNFSNRRVTEIFQDSRGTLWVAYSGTGLCRLDKSSGCMECLNLGQDRIDGNIAGILEVEDALWFSSNTGISRYNLKDQSLVHFDRRSGLQGNIFTQKACLRSRGGLLFFGGTNGMNVFDPSHIELDVGFPK